MSSGDEPMETDNNSDGMNSYHNEMNGSQTNSLDYHQPDGQEVPNGTPQKKESTTVHLKVVWQGNEPPPKGHTELQKALQTWFSKNSKCTECLGVTPQGEGTVMVEISPAAGQEGLFTQETELNLKKNGIKVSVKRVIGGDSAPAAADLHPTSVPSSAPPEAVNCSVPLLHFCYVNQLYRERIKHIERENRVQILPEVRVSFKVDPSIAGGDPDKALSEFTDLVQSCLGDSNCFPYSYELGHVDWEKTLQLIQQDQHKLTLSMSSHEVEVCGPIKSLKAFESVSKMQRKIPNTQIPSPSSAGEAQGRPHRVKMNFRDPLISSGFKIDPAHWVVITTIYKKKLAELESSFGVKFHYVVDKVKARAEPEMSKDADTLERHALRALLSLYQRVATSVMSCSLLRQSPVNKVGDRLPGLPGVVPDQHGDQWRIIGLAEDLRKAVEDIESNIGGPVFKEEDKQRIDHLSYGVDSSGRSDRADGEHPVRGAPADEEECCCICLGPFNNKITLPCTHMFCNECLEESKRKVGLTCPMCKAILGTMVGDQPDGKMTWTTQRTSLPGFPGHNTILIKYDIPAAKQTAQHPNPGRFHSGASRCAYLPDNREGQRVLRLLQRAFDQKLIFTVGTSRTTGSDNQVTWNDIHHKTNISGGPEGFGYPDPDYLQRVKEELKARGIE